MRDAGQQIKSKRNQISALERWREDAEEKAENLRLKR